MFKRVPAALAVMLLAAPAAWAASNTEAVMAEVSAALAAGDSAAVDRLASTALSGAELTAPQQAQLLLKRGLARDQRGAHDDALIDYTRGLDMRALTPMEQARGLFDRAVTLEELGRDDDALADYNGAIRLVPRLSSALNNRANLWRRRGRVANAKRDYLAALTTVNLHPEFSYFGLGQLAEQASDRDAARAFYAKAVAFNPGYAEATARLEVLDTAADAPLGLRPPPAAVPDRVVLRPPQAVRLHLPFLATTQAMHRPRPALVLRPALDASTRAIPAPSGGVQLQLGAWRSAGEADQGWSRAQGRAPSLLEGLSPQIVPVDLPGKGRYYRLRIRPPEFVPGLCAALEAKGVECMVTRDR